MSRIGSKPIEVPKGVEVRLDSGRLAVRGPKGELGVDVPPGIEAVPGRIDAQGGDRTLNLHCGRNGRPAFQGLARALAANCVTGVTKGFSKQLEIVGVGYRARKVGRVLIFQLGYSHPIELLLPDGVDAVVEKNTKITVTGIDKQAVGQTAADIRALRKPDPYKQKGVRYVGERLRSKEGKSGVS